MFLVNREMKSFCTIIDPQLLEETRSWRQAKSNSGQVEWGDCFHQKCVVGWGKPPSYRRITSWRTGKESSVQWKRTPSLRCGTMRSLTSPDWLVFSVPLSVFFKLPPLSFPYNAPHNWKLLFFLDQHFSLMKILPDTKSNFSGDGIGLYYNFCRKKVILCLSIFPWFFIFLNMYKAAIIRLELDFLLAIARLTRLSWLW